MLETHYPEPCYIYNFCAKYLARTNFEISHNYSKYPKGTNSSIYCEPWHFPIVDSYRGSNGNCEKNRVTFIYYKPNASEPINVLLFGSFTDSHRAIPLSRIENSPYYAVTVIIPKGELHTYLYQVDGKDELDPVNPQKTIKPNGEIWSRFFTDSCSTPVTFETIERMILTPLVQHILPFNTAEGLTFLSNYVDEIDQKARESELKTTFRFDKSIGVVNFIDKLLAKEESHYLDDYRKCLSIIQKVLNQRFPGIDPEQLPENVFISLYKELSTGNVIGWDYDLHEEPRAYPVSF